MGIIFLRALFCGYIITMPIPFGRLGLFFKLFSSFFYPRAARQRLSEMMGTVERGAFVVDLGGGTGTLLAFAHRSRSDLKYICVDPAIGMLRYAPRYAFKIAARAEDLPFRDRAVGAVTMGEAIHHFTDPTRGIEEVRRVLKAGGKVFVFDFNPEKGIARAVTAFERFSGEPVMFYPPRQLQELLSEKGFTVLRVSGGWRYTVEAASS